MSGSRISFERSDLGAVCAALLLAAAAAFPSARGVLLAAATCVAVAWLGWDALRSDRRGPRARLVMAAALLLLAALPAVLLAVDHGLWNGSFPGLDGGLALWAVGILSIAIGARAGSVVPLPFGLRAPDQAPAVTALTLRGAEPRGAVARLILAGLVLVCLAAFVYKVGGPASYLRNLNSSGATTFGLTYFIWGISCAKYGAFLSLSETWAAGRRPSAREIVTTGIALGLLLFVGSRLLLLVALLQLLLLYAALRPTGRGFTAALAGTAAVGVIAFVVIGELRRWESVPNHPSFPSYLFNSGLPELPRTYVNNYADAVRLSVLARRTVPSKAGYEYGKELLRIVLQPLPSQIRPTIGISPGLAATFTSGKHNGNALPVPVEGYIEFGFVGTAVFGLLLGLGVGLIDRAGPAAWDVGWLAASIAAGTGAVTVFRGSLAQGIALATIDVIGFFVAHRILYRRLDGGDRAPAGVSNQRGREPQTLTGVTTAAPES